MDESELRYKILKSFSKNLKSRSIKKVPIESLIFECDRYAVYTSLNLISNGSYIFSLNDLSRKIMYQKILSDTNFLDGYHNIKAEYLNTEGIIPEVKDGTLILKYLYSNSRYKKLPYPHHIKLASIYKFLVEKAELYDNEKKIENQYIDNVYIVYFYTENIAKFDIYPIEMADLLPDIMIEDMLARRGNVLVSYIKSRTLPQPRASWECGYCPYIGKCMEDVI